MRILLVSTAAIPTPPEAYGGMEREVNYLARGLREKGHEVTVCGHPDSTIDGLIPGENEPEFAEKATRIKSDIDVIIDFSHDKVVTRKLRDTPQINCYQVMTLSNPNNPVFISRAQREHIGREEAPVIYYGIDLDEYPIYTGPRDDYLLYMGSLIKEKRVHWVAEIGREMGLPVKIYGPKWQPEYWPTLDTVETWDNVEIHPDIGGAEKLHIIQHAKCLVHPVGDYGWVEAGAIIALEAMACGTPVVGSTNGCLSEYITCGVNGYISNNMEGMKNGIRNADTIDPEKCRAYVTENHRYQVMAALYASLATDVIDGDRW